VLKDLNCREIVIMVPLIALIFIMGVYPNPFIEKMDPAIKKLVAQTRPASMTAQLPAVPGLPAGHPMSPPEQTPSAVQAVPEAAPAAAVNPHEAK